MKKFFSVFLFTLICTAVFAQSGHLKFMGIPIDGTISQFQSKLLTKGCSLDANLSSIYEDLRVYDGVFVGEVVKILVYYEPSTKIVYRVKSVIPNLSEESLKSKYYSIKDLYMKKYKDCKFLQEENDKTLKLSYHVFPQSDDLNEGENINGEIDIYSRKSDESPSHPYLYHLQIDYLDKINNDRYTEKMMDGI